MRSWITTLIECCGITATSAGVTSIAGGPWVAVASIVGGCMAVVGGVVESKR